MHHGKHSPAQCKIPCHSHFAYTQNKMTCKATNTTNMHDIATGKSWHCHISANMQQSCQAHLFPSLNIQQFQNTFNPLFKVLFIFPARYLFAIGLVYICSCRWNIPPALRSNPKERDSMKSTVHNNMHMTHRTFTFLDFFKKFSCTPWLVTHLQRNNSRLMAPIPMLSLFMFTRHYLSNSYLVFDPPLTYMLKFSGCSYLISYFQK